MNKTNEELVGRFARSIESGWLGKIIRIEGEGVDRMCVMHGVDELYRAIKGGDIEAAVDESDICYFSPDDLKFITLIGEAEGK